MFIVYLCLGILAGIAIWRGCVYYIEKTFPDWIKNEYEDGIYGTAVILSIIIGVIITTILCKLFLTFSF